MLRPLGTGKALRLAWQLAVYSALLLLLLLAGIWPHGVSWGEHPAVSASLEDRAAAAPRGSAENNDDVAIPNRNLVQIVREGGLLMIPIFGGSLIMMAFCFERVIMLRHGRVVPRPFVQRILDQVRESQLSRDEALGLCERNGSPVARVFAAALRKWGRPAVEIEQAAIDAGERVANELRRYLLVFHGVSTVSPLLGLLGTVFGMIDCFNVIAQADAMGRPELLARGISEALLTTAAGLAVAIPALCLYLYFSGRADRLVMEIDVLGEELVSLIAGQSASVDRKPKGRGASRSAA